MRASLTMSDAIHLAPVSEAAKLKVPNLESLGIYNIQGTSFYNPGKGGRMLWPYAGEVGRKGYDGRALGEIAGVVSEKAMPTYPHGFPEEIIEN